MIGNKFYTWFKNYYQWVGGAFNETLLLPLVRATSGLRAGAIRYDEVNDVVETYDGTNWNAIPSATGFVPSSRTITINGETQDLSINRIYSVGTVTSVGLSAPAAFNVSGSPVTGSGTLALTAAGLASQYVRGDGTLANFPTSTGGGSSVSYYLNGSTNQGTFAGSTYYEMSKTAILGAGTNFTINTNGYIASFITDAGDPSLTEIPAGNWNLELYFSASSGGGNPTFYVELAKWDGSGFTAIASNQSSPDSITGGTNKDAYFTALAVPQTTLSVTDRLAIRIYVTPSGRTITLHTENNNLCQIITTFSTGLTALNGLTAQVQNLATGTSGNDFNIVSAGSTHTFNIPTASATNRGALNSTDWAIFNAKQAALTLTTTGSSGASTLVGATLNVPEYTLSGLGGVPTSRQLTINGTAYDLSVDRSWTVGDVRTDSTYSNPSWITALAWSKITNTPTTLNGYGITDGVRSVGLTTSTTGVTIGSTPVTGSGNITIDIATASGSAIGLLSSSDWTTFNNKQNALTLTTSGSSGAATLVGATLNIPQYQAAGNYITALTGEVTASGPGSASATLTNSAVIGKVLTGLNLSGGGTIAATDTILQAFGKVQNQISAMVGGVMFQGTWNASTNTPTLASGTGTKGHYYIVDVSGTTTLDGKSDWRVGDWAIFNGSTWDKVDNTDAVSSVNGFTGAVSLSTSHINEGTNLYYTDARARAAITLTTTGNSGSATYSGGTLNVPTYTLAGLGGVASTRTLTINGTAFDLSADRSWSVGTVTSVGLSSATSGVTIGNTPVTGSGTITLAIATASGSQNGLLSSTDWTTFNNKQNALTNPVTGTGTSGQVAYFNGTSTITSESNLFWNAANNRLGIGTATPAHALDVVGSAMVSDFLKLEYKADANSRSWIIKNDELDAGDLNIMQSTTRTGTTYSTKIRIKPTGEVIIGNSVGNQFTVNGAATFSSSVTAASFIPSGSSVPTNGMYLPAANTLAWATNSGIKATLDSSGNLGLGVTPSAWGYGGNFQFKHNIGTQVDTFNIAGNAYDNSGWKYASNGYATINSQDQGRHIWYTAPSGTAGNAITFTQAMTLDADGDLGIGVTNPTARVDIQRNGASAYSNLSLSNTNSTANLIIGVGGSSVGVTGLQNNAYVTNTGNSALVFGTNDTERMRITSGGNVGIGTTAPTEKLDVVGNIVLSESGYISGRAYPYDTTLGAGADATTTIVNAGLTNGYRTRIKVAGGSAPDANTIIFYTATPERMRITSGGNVGIGTTSPNATLHVNGTIQTGAPSGGTAAAWKLGSVGTQALTQSKYVEAEINGTTYWLLATEVQV